MARLGLQPLDTMRRESPPETKIPEQPIQGMDLLPPPSPSVDRSLKIKRKVPTSPLSKGFRSYRDLTAPAGGGAAGFRTAPVGAASARFVAHCSPILTSRAPTVLLPAFRGLDSGPDPGPADPWAALSDAAGDLATIDPTLFADPRDVMRKRGLAAADSPPHKRSSLGSSRGATMSPILGVSMSPVAAYRSLRETEAASASRSSAPASASASAPAPGTGFGTSSTALPRSAVFLPIA